MQQGMQIWPFHFSRCPSCLVSEVLDGWWHTYVSQQEHLDRGFSHCTAIFTWEDVFSGGDSNEENSSGKDMTPGDVTIAVWKIITDSEFSWRSFLQLCELDLTCYMFEMGKDHCIWCRKKQPQFCKDKPYCMECATECVKECISCHKPYDDLSFFELHPDCCNSCCMKLHNAKMKREVEKREEECFSVQRRGEFAVWDRWWGTHIHGPQQESLRWWQGRWECHCWSCAEEEKEEKDYQVSGLIQRRQRRKWQEWECCFQEEEV